MRDVVMERMAVESEVIPPVVELLLPDIEACGQPDGLGGIVGIQFQLLLHRQRKELIPHFYHSLHYFCPHSVIDNLQLIHHTTLLIN